MKIREKWENPWGLPRSYTPSKGGMEKRMRLAWRVEAVGLAENSGIVALTFLSSEEGARVSARRLGRDLIMEGSDGAASADDVWRARKRRRKEDALGPEREARPPAATGI